MDLDKSASGKFSQLAVTDLPTVSRPVVSLVGPRRMFSRPELKIREGLRRQLLQLIKNHSYTVAPTRRLEVASDPMTRCS